jgi:DNA modification methylase
VLRSYLPDGHDDKHLERGLEQTPEEYVARMVEVFREVRRVLREDGTCWVNLGDSYGGGSLGRNDAGRNIGGRGGNKEGSGNPGRQGAVEIATGLKPKDLVGIPWRVAFALQADGWWLRQDIIWHKPNPMPESVRDRCTKAHEYVFLLTKSERYFYDAEAVSETALTAGQIGGFTPNAAIASGKKPSGNMIPERGKAYVRPATRNRRSVWTITTKPYSGAHFAVMPPDLVEPCIKAGCPEQCCPVCGTGWRRVMERERKPTRPGVESKVYAVPPVAEGSPLRSHAGDICGNRDPMRHCTVSRTIGWAPACDCAASVTMPGTVLDPFAGSGTTLAVAAELGRNGIGCELNPEYITLAEQRIAQSRGKAPLFA